MANFNDMFRAPTTEALASTPPPIEGVDESPELKNPAGFDDDELLKLWEIIKRESFEHRDVFQRQWVRNIYYILGRQWLEYHSHSGGWKDKRMAVWIPRPVTNKCKETLQAIRAMFTSIKLGVNVRPNGSAPENVSAAAVADELAPLIHEDHDMNSVINEFDFWLIVTGNAFLHTFLDYDIKYGQNIITAEQCTTCGNVVSSEELAIAPPAPPGWPGAIPCAAIACCDKTASISAKWVVSNPLTIGFVLSSWRMRSELAHLRNSCL